MIKTGKILKEARENKNLSLHEIGMSLKINPKTLQAMEEGDLSKLPAKSFLKGFVKSYASYLKLDVTQIISSFQSEMDSQILPPAKVDSLEEKTDSSNATEQSTGQTETPPPQPARNVQSISIKSMKPTAQINDSFFSNKILLTVATSILVVLIVTTAKLVEKYQKERVIDQSQLLQIQEDMKVAEVSPTAPALNPEEKKTDDNPVEILKNIEAPKEELKSPVSNPESLKTEVMKPEEAPPDPQAQAPVQASVQASVQSEPKPESTIAAVTEEKKELAAELKPTEVILEALNAVTVGYTLDDGKKNTVELSPDQIHVFKSNSKVELEISDGGAVSLIVNGRQKGIPGINGTPIKIVYPKK